MMPFFLTMPIKRMIPIMPITSSGMPNSIKVKSAPSPADGKVAMFLTGSAGWDRLPGGIALGYVGVIACRIGAIGVPWI
jgi:hypothetical protein